MMNFFFGGFIYSLASMLRQRWSFAEPVFSEAKEYVIIFLYFSSEIQFELYADSQASKHQLSSEDLADLITQEWWAGVNSVILNLTSINLVSKNRAIQKTDNTRT